MQNCLFCHSVNVRASFYPSFTFNNKQFQYIICNDCKLVYLNPLLSDEDLAKLYSLDYHNEFYFAEEKQYEEQLSILKSLNISGRLLDYGCGDASFLRYLRNKGFTLHGAEYQPELVAQLSRNNQDCSFYTIVDLLQDETQRFDVIHLGDVLEHLVNPGEIMEKLSQKLNPGGVFFIEGPIEHNRSLAFLTRKTYFQIRKWMKPKRVVDTLRPYHIFFANRDNQLNFFRKHGLELLYMKIFEWAWPYPETWKSAKTLIQKVEFFVGQLSKVLSKSSDNWGNRFYYVGRLKDLQAQKAIGEKYSSLVQN